MRRHPAVTGQGRSRNRLFVTLSSRGTQNSHPSHSTRRRRGNYPLSQIYAHFRLVRLPSRRRISSASLASFTLSHVARLMVGITIAIGSGDGFTARWEADIPPRPLSLAAVDLLLAPIATPRSTSPSDGGARPSQKRKRCDRELDRGRSAGLGSLAIRKSGRQFCWSMGNEPLTALRPSAST